MRKKQWRPWIALLLVVFQLSSLALSAAALAEVEQEPPAEAEAQVQEEAPAEAAETVLPEQVPAEAAEEVEAEETEAPEAVPAEDSAPAQEPSDAPNQMPSEAVPEQAADAVSAAAEEQVVDEAQYEQAGDGLWFRGDEPENGGEVFSLIDGVTTSNSSKAATDGQSFTAYFKMTTPKDYKTEKSVKLVVSETSHLIAYCLSSGADDRVLKVSSESGKFSKDIPALNKNNDLGPSVALDLEPGTYYVYSSNKQINLFALHLLPGKAPRKAWSDVAAPVVEDVVRQEDGSLQVTFTGEFGLDGADMARVFLLQDGFEVDCKSVNGAAPVTFMPITNGDFTIKVVLLREGEADKESEPYLIEDYRLPPPQPAITWLTNLGEGRVYADWNNVEADQGCDVYYKLSSDEAFTLAAEGCTAGNYTFTGLTPGEVYTVKVVAKDSVMGSSEYERDITVGKSVQEWYVDDFGSATSGTIKVNDEAFAVKSYGANYPISKNLAPDITDGSGVIEMTMASENGKIADSEEGIQVYYTRLNPNTENFKLTATFSLKDKTYFGNQAGFGVYAIDIAGLGTKDAKYMNSVAVGNFKLRDGDTTRYHYSGVRVVTGYDSYDPTSTSGTGRELDNTHVFSARPEADDLVPGEQYTYTLEKTGEGFLATYQGETIEIPDVTKIMVQEDGSMVVAVAVGRCNAVIEHITFEKTEGSAAQGGAAQKLQPKVSVYSSNTSARQVYTFMADANNEGILTLSSRDAQGNVTELGSAEVNSALVAKLDVMLWNKGGENELFYSFQPDGSNPNLTDYAPVEGSVKVAWQAKNEANTVFYTSPDAPVNGAGTREDPADLQTLLSTALPGQTILMLDGTYAPDSQYFIPRNVSGTADAPITLRPANVSTAEDVGRVRIVGDNLQSASLFHIVGSYWHVYGLELSNEAHWIPDSVTYNTKGISVSGNHNIVELCLIHHVGNSGIQISRYSGEPNVQEMWPSCNLIKNCESYNCCDSSKNDADGFAAKLTCGEGNVFYGCISHHNIDDGWDLYAKSTTGSIGAVTVENCVAYSNGFLLTDDDALARIRGEGNGFKLGGENMYGGHKLINSVSFNNWAKGITSNSCPDCQVIDCTAYNNSLKGGSYNISLYTKSSNVKGWVVSGTISLATNGTTAAELGSSNGVVYSLRSSSNYLFDGKQSLNTLGEQATEDWFESVDVTTVPTRNDDGTINMHALLVLKDTAPANSGARLNTASDAASPAPVLSLTGAVISPIAAQPYTGKALTPAVVVTLDGNELQPGTDYTAAYADNVKIGSAAVTVTGIGNYTGTLKGAFTIKKASQTLTVSAAPSVVVGKTVTVSAAGVGAVTYASSNKKVATVSGKGVVKAVAPGTVTITVKAAGDATRSSAVKTVNITVYRCAVPVISRITNGNGSQTITWNKVSGAVKYRLFYKSGGKWVRIADTASTSYTWNKVKHDTRYTYTVRCIDKNGKYISNYVKGGKSMTYLSAPALSSVKNAKSKTMTVTWKTFSGVTGYQIQYSTSRDFSSGNKAVTVKGASNASKVISSLGKNKGYYVRIRSYKTVSGVNDFSAWSGVKGVKIAK